MKKMKKFLAMMMALVMVLGMAVTVSAADTVTTSPKGDKNDRGSITITNVDAAVPSGEIAEGTKGIKLYPILQAAYDETTGAFKGYVATSSDIEGILDSFQKGENQSAKGYIDALKDGAAKDLTAGVIKELAGKKGTALEGVVFTKSSETTDQEINTATYTSSGVPVGMYLVEIPGTENIIYNHAVASVYYKKNNVLGNDELNLSIENAAIVAKATETPGITKEVKVATGDKGAGSSANVGDIITYQVTINPVPNYSGSNPILNVEDKLSSNLELQATGFSVKVYDDETDTTGTTLAEDTKETDEDTEGTAGDYKKTVTTSTDETTLKIDFVVRSKYKLTEYAGKRVVIEYQAKLLKSANGNEEDNSNEATLNYTRDSELTGDNGEPENPPTDKTHTYTFNVGGGVTGLTTKDPLQKVGEGTDANGLKDAEFTIYTEDPTNNSNAAVYNTNPNHVGGIVKSGEGGTILIKGLKAGIGAGNGITYYLKETKAPGNYTLNSHVFKIYVEATLKTDGTLDTWTIKIDDANTNTFSVTHDQTTGNDKVSQTVKAETVQIQNTKMSTLPSTGGIGTTIFTIAGCAIMILAAALFFVSRRKDLRK